MKSISFSGMMKGDVISKKMNEAIAQMSFSSDGSKLIDQDNSGKKMDSTVALVKSIRLQSPANHTGLVIAFSSITCEVPLPIDVGLSYSWFRIREGQKLATVPVENPTSSIYLPTIDDVGYNICAQIEDTFGLGLSRHIESDVIKVDPMLCATAESFFKDKFYKICETRIHFGSEGPEPSAKSSSNSSNSRGTSGSLLMDGMSSIEVDTGGLFLSVPVSTEVVSTGGAHPLSLDDQDSNEKRSRRILKKGASLFVINGKKVPKRLPNDNRMMLHIPASEGITVTCSQPASLIISIPLQRAASPYSSSKDRNRDRDRAGSSSTDASSLSSLREGSSKSGGTQSSHQDHADLGSAIAPWSYIQCHNEKAFDVTDDDKVEASDFARNLSSLERYIAGLPSHAVEVKICISCAHRLERDALVLAVRALAAQQPNATSERRRSALPWTESGLQQFPRPGDRCAVFGGTYDNASVTTDTTQSPSSHVLSPIASSLDSQQIRQLHDALAAHSEKETQFSAIRVKLESGNDELQQKVAEFKGICDRKDEELSALEEICTHKEVLLADKCSALDKMTASADSLKLQVSDMAAMLRASEKTASKVSLPGTEGSASEGHPEDKCGTEWTLREKDLLQQIESLTAEKNSSSAAVTAFNIASAAELAKSTAAVKAAKDAEALIEKMKIAEEELQGEVKRLKRCTDSQSRDLKRVIREKDALEKALQVSTTAAAEAAASAVASAAAAASAASTRKNSDCPLPLQKTESSAGWESLLHVPAFKSVKSSSSLISVSQRTAAMMPDITAYLKGTSSSSPATVVMDGSDRNGLEEETSSSATGNPFGDSDIPDTHLSRRLADDGNYSDCDNESDEEEESDHETDSPRNDEKELISTTKPRLVAGAGTVEQEEVSSRNSVKKKLIRTFLG